MRLVYVSLSSVTYFKYFSVLSVFDKIQEVIFYFEIMSLQLSECNVFPPVQITSNRIERVNPRS